MKAGGVYDGQRLCTVTLYITDEDIEKLKDGDFFQVELLYKEGTEPPERRETICVQGTMVGSDPEEPIIPEEYLFDVTLTR